MKKIKITIILLFLGIYSFAQVPGYMGRKLVLSGTFLFGSPEFFGEAPATVNSKRDKGPRGDQYGIGLHAWFKASAEYVIGEHYSLHVAYKMSKMGFVHEDDIITNSFSYLTQLNLSTIDLGIKWHVLGNIAPIGNYFSFGLSLNTAVEKDKIGNSKIDSVPFIEAKTRFGSAFFNYGHNISIAKFLILSTQVETNLNPIPLLIEDDSYRGRVLTRWQKSVWFNFGLGLGYIIH